MRKKSHLALSNFLIKTSSDSFISKYKMAYRFGNILPDLRISFIYKRHEFKGTIDDLEQFAKDLVFNNKISDRKRAMMLGEVNHYVADYFTLPHNDFFEGNMKEHCEYEETLKQMLRRYLKTEHAYNILPEIIRAQNVEEVFDEIKKMHELYAKQEAGIYCDIEFIVVVNYLVAKKMLILAQRAQVENKLYSTGSLLY
ncbi:zinc dependent phospholipase C family protein [Lachnobacterium bovis]|uniref:Zinc dependent phospholipase C n=1 Tax=Lachnobacterium bovis TaxID=140626 RepID=A0A1H9TTP8_9FIRM|nr:zinc dependent phospholipase C family protein [Lachnobacterium bovis]SES00113.1 Zinc dependent phospholipase C [Lachnobacterium bovis]